MCFVASVMQPPCFQMSMAVRCMLCRACRPLALNVDETSSCVHRIRAEGICVSIHQCCRSLFHNSCASWSIHSLASRSGGGSGTSSRICQCNAQELHRFRKGLEMFLAFCWQRIANMAQTLRDIARHSTLHQFRHHCKRLLGALCTRCAPCGSYPCAAKLQPTNLNKML